MRNIPFVRWIANAAARFSGIHGAVASQARRADCSRQTIYDQARKVHAAVEAEHSGDPPREPLIREIEALRRENTELWKWLDRAVEFPQVKQQEFSALGRSMGLSLNQISDLLIVVLGEKVAPARSSIERWVQAAGEAAGRVLKRLDAQCKALVLVACLDEIFFHGRPVLVGVEPHSMVWFLGQKATSLTGSAWAESLQAWDALQYVVADAGRPLQAGISRVQAQRVQDNQKPLASGRDVFHTKHEARKALTSDWNRVQRDCEAFDQAEAQVHKDQRQGINAQPAALRRGGLGTSWSRASTLTRRSRPLGSRPNLPWGCSGPTADSTTEPGPKPKWRPPCRGWWVGPGRQFATTFKPQRASRSWTGCTVSWRGSLSPRNCVRPWCGCGGCEGSGRTVPSRGRSRARDTWRHLVQQELCQKLDANWLAWYRQVAAVLRGTVRASSAVECMNSVLRMHQGRHRTMTQGMLDLKRLYWNCREFRGGKRKGKCPYEHLGLKLPRYEFWKLLQEELPEALEQAKAKATGKARAA